jgi:small subunit ribosomal protein S6
MADAEIIYDLNVLLDSELPEEQRERILADVEAMVAETGTIVSAHDWGRRKMAYEIRHKTDADYHLIQFHGPRELLDRLDRTLRITDGVVRYRIIKLRPGTPPPPDLKAAAPVTAAGPAGSPEPDEAA